MTHRNVVQTNDGTSTAARRPTRTQTRIAGLALGLGVLGMAIAGEASAGCAEFATPPDQAGVSFKPAVYVPGESPFGFTQVSSNGEYWHHSIVGLWRVEFLAKNNTNGIPDGALIDFGTATWHADGTEAMVSGGRDPSTGDVCMGVWEQTGEATYKLTHVALAWAAGSYAGPTTIEETVTLDQGGKTFHGTFTITAHAAGAAPGHEFDESTVVPPTPIHGVIKWVRVTVE